MKKMMVFAFAFIFLTAITSEVFALTASLRTDQRWTGYHENLEPKCQGFGFDCLVIIVVDPIRIPGAIENVQGGRIIEFTFDEISEEHIPNPGLGPSYIPSGISKAFYTFGDNSKLRIDECPEDETLIGLELNISGKTTDNNGVLRCFIPF